MSERESIIDDAQSRDQKERCKLKIESLEKFQKYWIKKYIYTQHRQLTEGRAAGQLITGGAAMWCKSAPSAIA